MKDKKDRSDMFQTGSLLRVSQEGIISDPLGSYTGLAEDRFETPVQDADDL